MESGPPRGRSCRMGAVVVEGADEARAVELMRRLGAEKVERADGIVEDGDWKDFDPLSLPQYI